MDEQKPAAPGKEVQQSKQDRFFKPLLPMIAVLIAFFALQEYSKWMADNEPVTGIGITYDEVVTRSTLLVSGVFKNTPAFQAGLKKGDIVLSVNGKEIVTASDFSKIIKDLPSGSKVELIVLRDGKELKVETEVAALKRKNYK